MNEIDIPRYVDAQPQLFFYELDEAIVFASCFGVGIWMGGWFAALSLLAGHLTVRIFKRFKNGALDGILMHMCYSAGILSLNDRYQDGLKDDYFL